MKTSTTTIVLAVALTIVTGLFSSTIFGLIETKTSTGTNADAAALFTGHVETVVRDADGNVKEYRQSDNLVVNNGENCASRLLFSDDAAGATATGVCTGTLTQGFNVIAIGTGTATAADADVRLTAESVGNGLDRALATTRTLTNGTGGTEAQAQFSRTFTNTGASTTIAESGLFNSTTSSTGGMFARQTFTGISLNTNDQLTVTWTINIGGTAGFT